MPTGQTLVSVAALVSVLVVAGPVIAEGDRTGIGPGAAPAQNDPNEPNPVQSPGRAKTSIPGEMEAPNAGMKGPKDPSGATESGNARLPSRPDGVGAH